MDILFPFISAEHKNSFVFSCLYETVYFYNMVSIWYKPLCLYTEIWFSHDFGYKLFKIASLRIRYVYLKYWLESTYPHTKYTLIHFLISQYLIIVSGGRFVIDWYSNYVVDGFYLGTILKKFHRTVKADLVRLYIYI